MLSVIVLTRNEEKNIVACLESLQGLGDEQVVFDSCSDDATRELAEKSGAKVYQRAFDNWANQRNAALAAAQGDWVLFVDADERADPEVAEEVRATIARADVEKDGPVLFYIPRKNYIFGKWIRHTGWSPDYQPRLMRRDWVQFDPGRPVHELVLARGTAANLTNPLTHLNYQTLEQFRKKQSLYTLMEAEELFAKGVRPRRRAQLGQPVREFIRRYLLLRGFLDGGHGLLLSVLMAFYSFRRQELLAAMWVAERQAQGTTV